MELNSKAKEMIEINEDKFLEFVDRFHRFSADDEIFMLEGWLFPEYADGPSYNKIEMVFKSLKKGVLEPDLESFAFFDEEDETIKKVDLKNLPEKLIEALNDAIYDIEDKGVDFTVERYKMFCGLTRKFKR